ncbi:MAG: DciA family protein [Planctomycetota bacterium]
METFFFETHTIMDEDRQLKSASGWQYRPKRTDSRLGDELVSYLTQRSRTWTKNAALVDAWERVVPPALKPFCRLDKRVGNTLYLQAEPGPYMHQAQLLSTELLDQIKTLAPRCGIQKIRVVPLQKKDKE